MQELNIIFRRPNPRSLLNAPRRRGGLTGRRAALLRERREILLASLQGCYFLARRSFEIHCKKQWPYKKTGYAGRYVLADLKTLLISKLLNLDIVGLYFSCDLSARRGRIL